MSKHNCHPESRFWAKDLPEYFGLHRLRGAFQPGFVQKPGEDVQERKIAAGPPPKAAQDDRPFRAAQFSALRNLQSRAYITNNKATEQMKPISSFIFILIISSALTPIASAQITDLPTDSVFNFQPQRSGDRTEEAFAAGQKDFYESNWQQALDSFSQVVKDGDSHADDALSWHAYAQNKFG